MHHLFLFTLCASCNDKHLHSTLLNCFSPASCISSISTLQKSEGGITHNVKSSSTPNSQREEAPCVSALTKDDDDDDGKVGGATTSKVTLDSGPNASRNNNDSQDEGGKVDRIDDDDACDEKQLLLMQIQEQSRENSKLRDDLDRLRRHLISVEDEYTTELLTAEDREKGLRNRLAEYEIVIQRLESQIAPQSRLQDGLQSQLQSITAERDSALTQLSSLDDRVQQLVASNERLQLLLEQTTKGMLFCLSLYVVCSLILSPLYIF